MKRLPVDVSNFELMIKGNYLYIDKTQSIYNLIAKRRLYFLSRPRRFGKSLLLSTLKEIFLGNKQLFKDLWIGKHSNYTWPEHPVLDFDFSNMSLATEEEFEKSFSNTLDKISKKNNIDLSHLDLWGSKLKNLIEDLAAKNKVVILIDEYDAPLLASLDDLNKAQKIQSIMRNIFSILKSMDGQGYVEAMFVTGVTKFSKTSIFSGFNNLNDMTLEPETATLLGYTKEELEAYFKEYIEQFSQEQRTTTGQVIASIIQWYNGYRFSRSEQKVLNPFSVLHCFDKKHIANYWLTTGTPKFLIDLLKKHPEAIQEIKQTEVSAEFLGTFDIEELPIETILYQTGYLTIAGYNEMDKTYTLDYPNQEVHAAFNKYLIASFTSLTERKVETGIRQLKKSLENNNVEDFCSGLQSLFANIPYALHIKAEAYYHSLLQLMLDLLGYKGQSEVTTSQGIIDLVIDQEKSFFIFEFKLDGSGQQALSQIIEKRYYEKFQRYQKPITLVGISFNMKDKKLVIDWKKQDLR